MNYRIHFFPVFLCLGLISCGGETGKSKDETPDKKASGQVERPCTYSVKGEVPEVQWIAYKFTEKTGVKGVFEDVVITNAGSGNSPASVLKGSEFTISTGSSNSGDAERDPKIRETFFGNLQHGDRITGSITEVSGDTESGIVEAMVHMNEVEKPVNGSYTLTGDKLELKFEMNVETWSATDALNALNKVCEDLHKGADGQSKLWPDVTLFVTTTLAKQCD